jgi:hypothetical protein
MGASGRMDPDIAYLLGKFDPVRGAVVPAAGEYSPGSAGRILESSLPTASR